MTTAAVLLERLRQKGVSARADGGTLRLRPASRLTPEEVELLRTHKTELVQALKRLAVKPPGPPVDPAVVVRLLSMPLDQFEREGCLLEVRVPWHPETLWFVPTEAAAEALVQEGVSRGRVWTVRELRDLPAIPGLTTEQVRSVALEFGGEVVEVRSRQRKELP